MTLFRALKVSAIFLVAPFAFAHEAPAVQTYMNASKSERLVICAPYMIKQAGLMELARDNAQSKGETQIAKDLAEAAFNVMYRGQTLQKMAESNNKRLLQYSWNMSAEKANRSAYEALARMCVDLYNQEWHAGRIPKDVEARAAEKIKDAQVKPITKHSLKPEVSRKIYLPIPDECRGRSDFNFNVCEEAKAYAEEVSKSLPAKLNTNLTLSTVFASGRKVVLNAVLSYDEAKFNEMTGGDSKIAYNANHAIVRAANSSVCNNPRVRVFIANGGQVDYVYRFIDGTVYLIPEIRSCQ